MVTEKIIKGPSKSQFLESFQRHNSGAETFVEFTTVSKEKLSGVIYALEHKGDAGNCFFFSARFNSRMLHGYYNVKTRKGWIQSANLTEVVAKSVKMTDMTIYIAAKVFCMLNSELVRLMIDHECNSFTLLTNIEPKDLVYPEGWHYDHGLFTNRGKSSDGYYSEIRVAKDTAEGEFWGNTAKYSTAFSD